MFTPGKPIYFRPFIGGPFHPIYNWIRGPPCTRAPTWRIIPEPWHRCFKRERENQKSPRGTISIVFVCAQRHMGCSFVALTQWKTHILCWLDFRRAEGRTKPALTEVQKASRKKTAADEAEAKRQAKAATATVHSVVTCGHSCSNRPNCSSNKKLYNWYQIILRGGRELFPRWDEIHHMGENICLIFCIW